MGAESESHADPALTAGLGGFDDAAHKRHCSLKHCPRCKFICNRERWLKLCPWLDTKFDFETRLWGVGCKVCNQLLEQKPEVMQRFSQHRHHFAQYAVRDKNLSMDRFKKHQESPAHRTAAQMGSDPSAGIGLEDGDGNVPTSAEWLAVLKHTEPSRLTLDVSCAGEKKKCAMMRYCLAEGHRAKQREFLAGALCISLQQDARGNRFLHRFKATNEKLEVMEGVIHLQKQVGTVDLPGAVGIRQASVKALEAFCTTGSPPSYGGLLPGAGQAATFHESSFRSIVPRIEAMAADAAADEQLALREMASIGGPSPVELKDTLIQTLPSLKAGLFLGKWFHNS